MTDDEEVAALNAEYAGRWHARRIRAGKHGMGGFDLAEEPSRSYHIVVTDPGEAAQMIARYEQNGYLVQ